MLFSWGCRFVADATWDYNSFFVLFFSRYQILIDGCKAQPRQLVGPTASNRITGLSNQAVGTQKDGLPVRLNCFKSPVCCCSSSQLIAQTDNGGPEPCKRSIHVWESPGSHSDNMTPCLGEMEINSSAHVTVRQQRRLKHLPRLLLVPSTCLSEMERRLSLHKDGRKFTLAVWGC